VQEQYAFGMNMPGRSFSVEEYRYGFNGKENQDELMANNNSQDFGARMYDARVGRWWGMDPLSNKKSYFSPFLFGANNPIVFVDPDGRTEYWSVSGKWIGTDGMPNGINVVITDYELVKEMEKNTAEGKYSKQSYPEEKTFTMPVNDIINEALNVYGLTEGNQGKSEYWSIMKKIDEGGYKVFDKGKGPDYDPSGRGNATTGVVTPEGDVSIHSHPTKIFKNNASFSATDFFKNPNDQANQKRYSIYIVVGRDGTRSFKEFENEGDTRAEVISIHKDGKELTITLNAARSIRNLDKGKLGKIFEKNKVNAVPEICPAYD
jgi:RHS repeat-associated protein